MEIDQLLLSKVLFLNGQDFLKRNDAISYGVAISMFQDSAEVLLRAIIKHVDADVKENEPFTSLWAKILSAKNNKNKIEVPFKSQMIEVNKARVSFKHFGHLPDSVLAFKFLDFTENFLRQSMKLFFDVNFDTMSMAELIKNKGIRDEIKKAEQWYAEGKYKECVEACTMAEIEISDQLYKILPRFTLDNVDSGIFARGDKLKDLISNIASEIKKQRKLLIAALLNLKLQDIIKFTTLVPSISRTYGGKVFINWVRGGQPSEEEANFCIQYVINYGLIVQDKFNGAENISTFYFYR